MPRRLSASMGTSLSAESPNESAFPHQRERWNPECKRPGRTPPRDRPCIMSAITLTKEAHGMFGDLFSKSQKPRPDKFRYDIPHLVRNRIFHHLQHLHSGPYREYGGMQRVLVDVCEMCRLAYGGLCQPNDLIRLPNGPDEAALTHFQLCPDEYAIDFIEMCFRSQAYTVGQRGV